MNMIFYMAKYYAETKTYYRIMFILYCKVRTARF